MCEDYPCCGHKQDSCPSRRRRETPIAPVQMWSTARVREYLRYRQIAELAFGSTVGPLPTTTVIARCDDILKG